ncbi:MAG: CHASE2 domain-containing protein, partial [Eubacteriales bacterium]
MIGRLLTRLGRNPAASASAKPGKTTLGKKRWLLALLLFVLMEAAVLAGVYSSLEMSLYDFWFRIRGVHNPGTQVVVIAIDDPSIQKIGEQYGVVFPWPRSIYGALLENLREARAVAFDIVFDVPTKPEEDTVLAEAVRKHGRVALASMFSFEQNRDGETEQIESRPPDQFGAAGIGFVNMPKDADQVVRSFTAADVNFEEP